MTTFVNSDSDDSIVEDIFDHKPPSPKSPPSPRKMRDFGEFFERQEKAVQRAAAARTAQPPKQPEPVPSPRSGRQLNSPPREMPKPKQLPAGYESPHNMSPHLQGIFSKSVKKTSPRAEPEPKQFEMSRPNQESKQIANGKYTEMIEAMFGPDLEMTERKLKMMLRNFALFDPKVAEKVTSSVKIDEDRFDAVKLKNLFIAAATETDTSKLARRIRPSVVAALSNMKPSPWYRHTSPRADDGKRRSGAATPTKTQRENKTSPPPPPPRDDGSVSYDASEEVPHEYKPKKQEVSPKKSSPRGEKYFPGFYDKIDFTTK